MWGNPHDMEVDVKPIHKEVDDYQKVYNFSPVKELESEFEEVINMKELVHKVDFVSRSDMECLEIKEE